MKKSLGQIFFLVFAAWLIFVALSSFVSIAGSIALLLVPIGIFLLVIIHAKRCASRGGSIVAIAIVVFSFLAILPLFIVAGTSFIPAKESKPEVSQQAEGKRQQSNQQFNKQFNQQFNKQFNKQFNQQLNQQGGEGTLDSLPGGIGDIEEIESALSIVAKVLQIYFIIIILAIAANVGGLLLSARPLRGAGGVVTKVAAAALLLTTAGAIFLSLNPLAALFYGQFLAALIVITGVLFSLVGFYRLGDKDSSEGVFSKTILDDEPDEDLAKEALEREEMLKEAPKEKPARETVKEAPKEAAKEASKPPQPTTPPPKPPDTFPEPKGAEKPAEPPTSTPPSFDNLAAGWYKDGNTLRYWDGSAWVAEQPVAEE